MLSLKIINNSNHVFYCNQLLFKVENFNLSNNTNTISINFLNIYIFLYILSNYGLIYNTIINEDEFINN